MDIQLLDGLNALVGPMRSGKSRELTRIISTYRTSPRHHVIAFRPVTDTRVLAGELQGRTDSPPSSLISSRSGTRESAIPLRDVSELEPYFQAAAPITSVQTILVIEEAHFMPNWIKVLEYVRLAPKVRVVMAVLGSRWDRSAWPSIAEIQSQFSSVKQLFGLCQNCNAEPAPFTWLGRAHRHKLSQNGVLVGDECYLTVCLPCWFEVDNMDAACALCAEAGKE